MKVPIEVVIAVYGARMPTDDAGRAAFFAVWALLECELEEALREERRKRGLEDPA